MKFKVYDTTPYAEMTLLQMLTQFLNKFGAPYDGLPRELSKAESAFRMECHKEEAQEYLDAVKDFDIVDCLDALADELYFLTGTIHRQGLGEYITNAPIALGYRGVKPHMLAQDANNMRAARHSAVLHNYEERVRRGDLIGQGMALNEAIRAFRATAQMHCFDIDEALRRVHAANMCKDIDPAKQRRTQALKEQGLDARHALEITKPDGWLAPYLGDLCGYGPYAEEEATELTPGKPLVKPGESHLCGLITIDGPDASGKSTLAARIAELFNGQVIHLTWSPRLEVVMDEYRTAAIKYAAVLAQHCVVVLERPWLSHPVYAEVYRKGDYIPEHVHNWKLLTEHNALLNIIALPGNVNEWFSLYKQMCGQRVELHGPNESKARAVYEGFRDAFCGDAGAERQPQYHVEVYDMQQHLGTHTATDNLDTYIRNYVLPVLQVKE